jgi:hypothetical protein
MREFCAQRSDQLLTREREFIDDLVHWRSDLTEKQETWLVSIYAHLFAT